MLQCHAGVLGHTPTLVAPGAYSKRTPRPLVCSSQQASPGTSIGNHSTAPAPLRQVAALAEPAGGTGAAGAQPTSGPSKPGTSSRPKSRIVSRGKQGGPTQGISSSSRPSSSQQQPTKITIAGESAKVSNAGNSTPVASVPTTAPGHSRSSDGAAGAAQGTGRRQSRPSQAGQGTERTAWRGVAKGSRAPLPRQTNDFGSEDDDEDADSVLEQEGDEAILDPDEIERLVFGGKDFLKGDSTSQEATGGSEGQSSEAVQHPAGQTKQQAALKQQANQLTACRAALTTGSNATTIPPQIADLALCAAEQGLVPVDAEALAEAVHRVLQVVSELPAHQLALEAPTAAQAERSTIPASNAPAAVRALWSTQAALSNTSGESAGDAIPLEEVLSAAIRVPGLLRLSHQDIRERLKALPAMLNMAPASLPSACCRHPEVLVAPLEEVRKKLLLLRNTTGLTGEAALDLMTPHMFGGM